MSTVNIFQISLEIWGCVICAIITMISGQKAYKMGGELAIVWMMLLMNGLLLISDAAAYIFDGDISTFGTYVTRVSNFMVFTMEGVMTWSLVLCFKRIIGERDKRLFEDKWTRLCGVLVGMQLTGIVFTPVTDFYYYFDETNHYHRAAGYMVTFVMLGLTIGICLTKFFLNRKRVSTSIHHTVRIAICIFGICFFIQFLKYGLSTINIGLTINMIMLYFILYKENERIETERRMDEVEQTMKELIAERDGRIQDQQDKQSQEV